jgi:hypothetical protein
MRRRTGGGRLEGVFVIVSLCGDWYEGGTQIRGFTSDFSYINQSKEMLSLRFILFFKIVNSRSEWYSNVTAKFTHTRRRLADSILRLAYWADRGYKTE